METIDPKIAVQLKGDTDGDVHNVLEVFDTVEPMPAEYVTFPPVTADELPWLLSENEEFEGAYSAEYNEQKYHINCPCGQSVEVYVSDSCKHCGRVFTLETRVFVNWKAQQ